MLHAAAWTDVDGAEDDPQGAAAVNVGGTAQRGGARRAAGLLLHGLRLRRRQAGAVRRVGRRRSRSRRTAGRSCTAKPPPAIRRGSCGRPACSAGPRRTSCGRCLRLGTERDEIVGRRRPAAARRRTSVISRQRCAPCSSCRSASTTSPPTATARGRSSPWRSSRRPVSSCRVRKIWSAEWGARRRVRRIRCCAARRPGRRTSRTGASACARASSGSGARALGREGDSRRAAVGEHVGEGRDGDRVELRSRRCARSSASAASIVLASRVRRFEVIASNASQTKTMRESERDLRRPRGRRGSPCRRSARGSSARGRRGAPERAPPMRIRSPISVCRRTKSHSSPESGPGFSRIASGIAILPMSCSAAGEPDARDLGRRQPELRATDSARCATPRDGRRGRDGTRTRRA